MAEEFEELPADTDLFGEPLVDPKDPRGRPKLHITRQTREKVKVLKALGMTQADIATAIGCSVPTLTHYFFRELKEAAGEVKARVIQALMNKVDDGNVAAIKAALQLLDIGALDPSASRPTPQPAAEEPKTEPLGKKEQANIDAASAHEGTTWGDVLGAPIQ
jgi:transcriptional regulator with XRE-family HTH domain